MVKLKSKLSTAENVRHMYNIIHGRAGKQAEFHRKCSTFINIPHYSLEASLSSTENVRQENDEYEML